MRKDVLALYQPYTLISDRKTYICDIYGTISPYRFSIPVSKSQDSLLTRPQFSIRLIIIRIHVN